MMSSPQDGPCVPWATLDQTCCPDVVIPDPDVASLLAEQASWILWALSGRTYVGPCSQTVPVCVPCDCSGDCCCTVGDRFDLGTFWPVTNITEILVDGAPFTAYRVDGYRWVTRTDGARWPRGVDMTEPTISVKFAYGLEPNAAARASCRALLCELAKACWSPSQCRLPQRASSITREGVSYAFLDPFEMLNEGRTGLYEVDLWLAAEQRASIARPSMGDPTAPTLWGL